MPTTSRSRPNIVLTDPVEWACSTSTPVSLVCRAGNALYGPDPVELFLFSFVLRQRFSRRRHWRRTSRQLAPNKEWPESEQVNNAWVWESVSIMFSVPPHRGVYGSAHAESWQSCIWILILMHVRADVTANDCMTWCWLEHKNFEYGGQLVE